MSRLTRPLTLLATALLVAIPSIAASAAGKAANLTLVAYSTPKASYDRIIPAFGATPAGSGVTFSTSYGASGTQAAAVIAGLKADVVNLSLAPDMQSLVKAGIVSGSWNSKAQRFKGMVTNSIVVFVVRPGNPKHIKTWNDLLKQGVDVITPNPFTSGGARWNVMAAYGAWRKGGATHKQAVAPSSQGCSNTSASRIRAPVTPCRRSSPVRATSFSRTRTRLTPPRSWDRRSDIALPRGRS
jgi:ABC-type sulfate transport system substrate-binding protein